MVVGFVGTGSSQSDCGLFIVDAQIDGLLYAGSSLQYSDAGTDIPGILAVARRDGPARQPHGTASPHYSQRRVTSLS